MGVTIEEEAEPDIYEEIGLPSNPSYFLSEEKTKIDLSLASIIRFILEGFGLALPILITCLFSISIIISLFIANPLAVGVNKLFLKASREEVDGLSDMFSVFGKGYLNVLKTMFFHNLYVALWSCLFIIPGIIKRYSYFMVPYIIADNPDISTTRAFEISKKTMEGNKYITFETHLSFIGWWILSIFTCGLLAVFYVNPYYTATSAEMYEFFRQEAIIKGYATEEEFGLDVDKEEDIDE